WGARGGGGEGGAGGGWKARDRPRADRGRSRPALRAQAQGDAHPRRTGQGAPQGRAEEGPQEASVLQALASAGVAERRHFGTDGVRGPVGDVLTPELAVRLGRAAALEADGGRPQVLIIRDTRESGPMLEE